jgi:hypothetical protein
MNFDLWEQERNKAEDLGLLKVLRNDTPCTVKIWKPKAKNPFANYRFKSIEDREQYIKTQLENMREHERLKAEWKAKRKATPELLNTVNVGDIFHYSWGYDQTQCEFYQIVEKKGCYALLKEIGQETVAGSEGFMCDHRIAKKDAFINNAKIIRKKILFSNGKPYFSFDFGSCSLWDGNSCYCSWYA